MDTSFDLDRLASDLADDGVEAHETTLARLVVTARAACAPAVAVAVLADRSEPAPARARAFAVVDAHLRRAAPGTTTAAA